MSKKEKLQNKKLWLTLGHFFYLFETLHINGKCICIEFLGMASQCRIYVVAVYEDRRNDIKKSFSSYL